jgi:hypothetical protein
MFVKEKTLFQTTKYATTKSLHWFDDGQTFRSSNRNSNHTIRIGEKSG